MTGHRFFAPSGGERWINCPLAAPGEARIKEQYGEEPPKSYMQEGTDAHARLEQVLNSSDYPLSVIFGRDYTEEERSYLLPCVRAVCEDLEMLEAQMLVEETIESKIDERLGGTPDVIVYSLPERRLIVTDYKHGVNHYVEADAIQLRIYGHLAAAKLGPENFDQITLRVVQPRYRGDADPVREHHIDDVQTWFAEFRTRLVNAINASDQEDPQPVKGDHCHWCKVACSERTEDIEAVIGPDIVDHINSVDEDIKAVCKILDAEKAVLAAIKQAKSFATRMLEAGYDVPGYGLKASIGNRKWIPDSDDKIARALRRKGLDKEKVWIRTLISPAQAGKGCKLDEKFFDRYVTREKKGLKLAKLKPGEIPAETPKEKLENNEMTESEKALMEGF